MPGLVLINQYRTRATNVELLEAGDCTITEAYKLLKNMPFLVDPCSIQAYIIKRLSNSDLEAIINCTNLAIYQLQPPTHCRKKFNQPLQLLSDYSHC